MDIRRLNVRKYGAVHGKLIGGGVAFALATDWCSCSAGATFNYGNLPRGVNPLFMFSRVLSEHIGYSAGFLVYLEDIVLSSDFASTYGLVHVVTSHKREAQYAAQVEAKARKHSRLGPSQTACSCALDTAHAALEVVCFAESFMNRRVLSNLQVPCIRSNDSVSIISTLPRPCASATNISTISRWI